MRTETKEVTQTITQYISDDGLCISTDKQKVEEYEACLNKKKIEPLFIFMRAEGDEIAYVYEINSREDFLLIKNQLSYPNIPKYYTDNNSRDLIGKNGIKYYVFEFRDGSTDYPYYQISTVDEYRESLRNDMEYDEKEFLKKQKKNNDLLKQLGEFVYMEHIDERYPLATFID